MKNKLSINHITISLIFFTLLSACGGGGGGDGGSSASSSSSSSGGGGVGEGVRVLLGAIDSPPLGISYDGQEFDTLSYNESSSYQGVPAGTRLFQVYRRDLPDQILGSVTGVIEEGKSYSLLVGGTARLEALSLALVEDSTDEPADGTAKVKFYNIYQGGGSLNGVLDGQSTRAVAELGGSNFLEVSPGSKVLVINSGEGAIKAVDFEATAGATYGILISGSTELRIIFSQIY